MSPILLPLVMGIKMISPSETHTKCWIEGRALQDMQYRDHDHPFRGAGFGIVEREVPQAYVRARASSATLCLVHVLRVFLCIFYCKIRI